MWNFITPVGSYQREGRVSALLFSFISLVSLRISRDWHWSVGAFFCYLGFWYVWNKYPVYSTFDFILIGACFFVIPEIYRNISLRTFENLFLLTCSVHAVVGLLNIFNIHALPITNPVYQQGFMMGRPHGLLGQETLLAPYLAWGAALLFHRFLQKEGRYNLTIGLFFLTVCMATKSTMGALSVVGAISLLIAQYGGVYGVLAMVPIGVIGGFIGKYFHPEIFDLSGRAFPWGNAWRLFLENPWFGYGLGSWKVIAVKLAEINGHEGAWLQVHSDLIQGLFEIGLVGMFFVFVFLFRTLWGSLLDKSLTPYTLGVVILGINALGNFPIHVVPHGPLFVLCLYVILQEGKRRVLFRVVE